MILPTRFTIIDTTRLLTESILTPFSFDEVHGRELGKGAGAPAVHLWRHPKAFVMGLRDRRLPHALDAWEWLEGLGYEVTVRNSGGAAVPLDPGVVNVSFILPNPEQNLNYQRDFVRMYEFLQDVLGRINIPVDKGEITGSYCPGEFDLSINGVKFCGIAQRRQTKAIAVQAFIVVEGSGWERAELVREFYQRASGGSAELDYPLIETTRMGSLGELTAVSSVEQFISAMKDTLRTYGMTQEIFDYSLYPREELEGAAAQLKERYEKRSG